LDDLWADSMLYDYDVAYLLGIGRQHLHGSPCTKYGINGGKRALGMDVSNLKMYLAGV
jgi:hypothetical protein